MGPRSYNRIGELPIPPSQKLFVNYGNPFAGWVGTLYVPRPWTEEDIKSNRVGKGQVLEFFKNNASSEFLREKEIETKKESLSVDELVELFESLYFWESFKTIDYEEPLARKPRYTLETIVKHEEEDEEEEEEEEEGVDQVKRERMLRRRERNRREREESQRSNSGMNIFRFFRRPS